MTIGIVVAFEAEILPFIENKKYETIQHGNYTLYKFSLGHKTVYACKQIIVGQINASAVTQMLISVYDAELIINFGVVGALTKKASVCSTFIVSGVAHYDRDITVENKPIGKYDYFDDVIIKTDEKMLAIAKTVMPNLPQVTIASGEKFVDDAELKQQLHKEFGAEICDMESAGIVITSRVNNVPMLLIKTVSDSLEGGIGEFYEKLQQSTTQYVAFVDKFLDYI